MEHKTGNVYQIETLKGKFILCETHKNTFALVNLETGKALTYPREIKNRIITDTLLFEMANKREVILRSEPTVLEEAQSLIFGQREKDYGSVTKNFGNIATGWQVITGAAIAPEQVALMMVWLKTCRANNGMQRDSLIDIAGYAGCIEKLQNGL